MQAIKTIPPQKAGHASGADPAPTLRLDLRARHQPAGPKTLESSATHATHATHTSPTKPVPRDILERELDRVQGAVQASEANFGQQLNWLLLAQALFLNAYLVVLVFGGGAGIPGRRWLLAGLALFAVIFAVFTYLALRGSRDTVSALRAARSDLEATLARQGRAPLFAPKNIMGAGLSSFAVGVLPVAFIVGWLVISIYALAAPNGSVPRKSGTAAVTHPVEPASPQVDRHSGGTARNSAARPGSVASTVPQSASQSAPQSAPSSSRSAASPAPAQPNTPTEEKKRTGFKW